MRKFAAAVIKNKKNIGDLPLGKTRNLEVGGCQSKLYVILKQL